MFYTESEISELIKCAVCKQKPIKGEPRMLPCGKTICENCLSHSKLECPSCFMVHPELKNGLPINYTVKEFLKLRLHKVLPNKDFEKLKSNIIEINLKQKELLKEAANSNDFIKEHCMSVRNEIQLAKEITIQNLNDEFEKLMNEVDEYEKKNLSTEEQETNCSNLVIAEVNKVIKENDVFITELESNLIDSDATIDENKTKDEIRKSMKVINELNECELKLKSMILNYRCLNFSPLKQKKFGRIYYVDKFERKLDHLSVYDFKGSILKTISNAGVIYCFSFLENRYLASGLSDGKIKIWNSNTDWTMIKSWQAHTGVVRSLLVAENGDLFSSGDDCLIKIWNTIDWSLKRTLLGHTGIIYSLSLLANGNIISGSDDMTFRIWDLEDGNLLFNKLASHQIRSLVVLYNQDICTAGSDDRKIKIWNYHDLSLKATLSGHTASVSTLLMLNNGDLASGAIYPDNRILIWDVDRFTIKHSLTGHTNSILQIIQLQNKDLASCSADTLIKIWSPKDWSCKYNLRGQSFHSLIELDNGYLASGSQDNTIKIWL